MAGHHAWTVTFGILGNIVSFLVFLSPVPTFYRIYREKATEGFQSIPYLVALFSSMVWLYYAFIEGNSTLLITISSFGCVIEMVYIATYIAYAPGAARNSTIKLFLVMNLGFSLIILITRIVPNAHTRNKVSGWICAAISVCVSAAPLSIVARVIRTKSVEFMPFYLSFFLTVKAVMWFCYGFFKKDRYIMIPNIPSFVLGLCQMAVYGYFRNKEMLPQHAANMVNDVHPVTVEIPPPVDGGEARADEQQLEGATDLGFNM